MANQGIRVTRTPGPWVRNPEGSRDGGWAIESDCLNGETWIVLGNAEEPVPVAIVTDRYDADRDERNNYPRLEANARLIAAAPDLLQAVKDLLIVMEQADSAGQLDLKNCVAASLARRALEAAGEKVPHTTRWEA